MNRSLGPAHLEASRVLYQLGMLEYESGRADEARRRWERARAIQREVFGPGHHLVARTEAMLEEVAKRK